MLNTILQRTFAPVLVIAGLSIPVQGAIIFNDTFENIGGTSTRGNDAGDPNDLNWLSALSPSTLGVVDDAFAGGGSSRALQFASGDGFRRFGANFTPSAIAEIGDQLNLSFAMRLTSAPDNNQWGFRFGLFNSGGTNNAIDNPNGTNQPSQQNNDVGYHARIATGSPALIFNEIYDEPSGDNPLGGAGFGGTLISSPVGTPVSITNQTLHTMSLNLTRSSATSITFSLSIDGIVKATGTDTSGIFTTFDTVYLGQGGIATGFQVDNVQLQAIPVPEPSTILFAGLCVAGILTKRRR